MTIYDNDNPPAHPKCKQYYSFNLMKFCEYFETLSMFYQLWTETIAVKICL